MNTIQDRNTEIALRATARIIKAIARGTNVTLNTDELHAISIHGFGDVVQGCYDPETKTASMGDSGWPDMPCKRLGAVYK